MQTVQNGDVVKVHYTGKLQSGEIFDSSAGRKPLEFTMGEGQMIQGFEAGILGMKVGDRKTLHIPSQLGYGEFREDMVLEVQKTQLPPDLPLEVGTQVGIYLQNGQQIPATLTDIGVDTVKIDANHPLAGKDLIFDVNLVEIAGGNATKNNNIILFD